LVAIVYLNCIYANAALAGTPFALCYARLDSVILWASVMKLRPLSDRLIVRRLEATEKTTGGILLPDNAKQKPQKGKVLAIGPGKMLKDGSRRALQVKVGDTVLFTTWAGDEYKQHHTGDAILIMHEEDVLAVV
jgi:chaperonin GroES